MSALGQIGDLLRLRALQMIALLLLLATLAWQYFSTKLCVTDLDLWWHVKVGDWIVEHRGFPHAGILSRTAAERPWIAYSWGYEVLLSRAYHWFGLMGLALFSVVMMLAVAWAVFWMVNRPSGNFWEAWLLTIAGAWAFLWYATARPLLFSMLFFIVILTFILEAKRTADTRLLYWLPPIFLLWANIHIQFIYGLFVVLLFGGVELLEHLAIRFGIAPGWMEKPVFPLRTSAAVGASCIAATLIGPYSYHLYRVIFEYSRQKVPYSSIIELQPLSFRVSGNYVLLLLAGSGFFVVGLGKRVDLFKLGLLTIACIAAFRTMRDSWFVCVPALACLADWRPAQTMLPADRRSWRISAAENGALAVALIFVLLLIARNTNFNQSSLEAEVRGNFPVDAANFVRRNHLAGPLYNTLNWGGFLTWYLPEYPVAIDGRNDLYGDEVGARFYSVLNGDSSYVLDPDLNAAHVILLQKPFTISAILSADPRFELVYQDDISAVYVRR